MSERWLRVLDEYESVIADQAAFVATGGRDEGRSAAFSVPADLPPLPPALAPRLADLGRRTAELIEHASVLADALEPGRPTAHPHVARSAASSTFDQRA